MTGGDRYWRVLADGTHEPISEEYWRGIRTISAGDFGRGPMIVTGTIKDKSNASDRENLRGFLDELAARDHRKEVMCRSTSYGAMQRHGQVTRKEWEPEMPSGLKERYRMMQREWL